jgi:cathepsin F
MGLEVPAFPKFNYVANFTNDPNYKPKSTTPDIWNWQQEGAVGPIKDQGSCGSCWTFSTAGNLESLNYLKNKSQGFLTLSEQQLIDCDKTNFGCAGGWPYKAIDWLANNGGLMNDKDYPLRANYSGPCQSSETKQRIQVKGYMNITHDEAIIKDAVYEIGPLSILLDFTGMMHYKSGVANPKLCSTWPDHALVLVGYGTKDEDYWLIKNSWGVKWGINGFLQLKRGANKCGINLWATTAVLQN